MNRVFVAILAGMLATQISHGIPLPQPKEPSWVGKTILPKKPGIKLMNLEAEATGFAVLDQGELTCADYKVLADADGWIKVRQDGSEDEIRAEEHGGQRQAGVVIVSDPSARFLCPAGNRSCASAAGQSAGARRRLGANRGNRGLPGFDR